MLSSAPKRATEKKTATPYGQNRSPDALATAKHSAPNALAKMTDQPTKFSSMVSQNRTANANATTPATRGVNGRTR